LENPVFATLSGAMRRLSLALGVIAGVGTAILMLTVVPDLFARSFFGEAVYGMAETGIFLLVLIVYLALGAAQVRKEHFHVGVLDTLISREAQRWVWVLRFAASALVSGLFAWYATRGAIDSTLSLEQSYAVIEYPIWPAKIVVAAGLALLTVQFLMDMVDALRTPQYLPQGGHEGAPSTPSESL
jgi:TRAP-type C4-dicarboxylate transport system permease small subunit